MFATGVTMGLAVWIIDDTCLVLNFVYLLLHLYYHYVGNTPLHTAVHNTHTEIAKMLVRKGANRKKKNLSGLTPYQLG